LQFYTSCLQLELSVAVTIQSSKECGVS